MASEAELLLRQQIGMEQWKLLAIHVGYAVNDFERVFDCRAAGWDRSNEAAFCLIDRETGQCYGTESIGANTDALEETFARSICIERGEQFAELACEASSLHVSNPLRWGCVILHGEMIWSVYGPPEFVAEAILLKAIQMLEGPIVELFGVNREELDRVAERSENPYWTALRDCPRRLS